jgi:hypothetical protein
MKLVMSQPIVVCSSSWIERCSKWETRQVVARDQPRVASTRLISINAGAKDAKLWEGIVKESPEYVCLGRQGLISKCFNTDAGGISRILSPDASPPSLSDLIQYRL